ncbi:MAG: hypothetical protein ACJAZH_001272 [Roseivirga sp.]|jgi:hypothetical protein
MDEIKNKVAGSGLITLSLEDYYPQGPRLSLDISPWLYEGLILREKDFRVYLKEHNWQQYEGAYVALFCSADAIVPQWSYMLLASYLSPFAKKVVYGSPEQLEAMVMEQSLAQVDLSEYLDKRVILKGCGDLPIPPHAYLYFTTRLQEVAKTIMFGEACSTVPIYKKAK